MSIGQCQRHIEALANDLRIDLEQVQEGYRYQPDERTVYGPCWRSSGLSPDVAYAVWLHEIGHRATRALPIAQPDYYRHNPIPAEVAAWQWARSNAIEWSAAMQARAEESLCLHLDRHDTDSNRKRVIAFEQ